MSKKIADFILIALTIVAVLLTIFTMWVLNRHEQLTNTPCEELLEKKGTTYVPIPKRCEKGE